MNIIEYYDGTIEKDETKEYKLITRVSTSDTLFLYFESIVKIVDEEKEKLKNQIVGLNETVDNLMLTVLDLIPAEKGVIL